MKWKGLALFTAALLTAFCGFLVTMIAAAMVADPTLPSFLRKFIVPLIVAMGIFLFIHRYGYIEVRKGSCPGEWGGNLAIKFRGQYANRLQVVKECTNQATEEDVVRDALRIHEYLVLECRAGTRYYKKIPGGALEREWFFEGEEDE
jgi:hypothetical protein